MSEIPTTRVQHPDDPRRSMIVNVADAHHYTPWSDSAESGAAPGAGETEAPRERRPARRRAER